MNKTQHFWACAIGLLAALTMAGCETGKPIPVIATFNLSGSDAVLDGPSFRGAELAAEQINASGGVLGRPIELIAVNTASDLPTTAQAVDAALKGHPRAVAGIGYSDSSYALAAGRVFQQDGLPFITSGATTPTLPEQVGDEMFLAAYGDDAQARVMAGFAYHRLKLRHVAVWINEDREYTRAVGAYFKEAFERLGGTVSVRRYAGGKTEFADLIDAFGKADPALEAIYAATAPAGSTLVVAQARAAGVSAPLLSGDGWDNADLVALSREQDLADIYFTTHRYLDVHTPAMRAFVADYTLRFGQAPPNAFAVLGYDTLNLLADAIRRAGSTDPSRVRDALADTTGFQGVVGPIRYAPGRRTPIKPVAVIELDRGEEKPVWTTTPPAPPR